MALSKTRRYEWRRYLPHWADPVAALVMVPLIAREGFEALRGNTCCECHSCDTDNPS